MHCPYCRRHCCLLSWRTWCSDYGFEEVGQLTLLLTQNLEANQATSCQISERNRTFWTLIDFEVFRVYQKKRKAKRKKTEPTRRAIYTLSCSPGLQMIDTFLHSLSLSRSRCVSILYKAHPFAKLDEMRLHSIVVCRSHRLSPRISNRWWRWRRRNRRGKIMKERCIYTQREEDLGLVDVFDFFFTLTLTLSLSLSRCLSYAPSFASMYVRIGTMQHTEAYKKKKESNMHTHNLETVVERSGRVYVCTAKQTNTCKPVDVSVYFLLDDNGEEEKNLIEKEIENFCISISTKRKASVKPTVFEANFRSIRHYLSLS